LFEIPRLIELRFEKIGREFDSFPPSPLLHGRIRTFDLQRIIIIQSIDCPRIDLINVRCQKHDVRR
jgi:hypothetical protein